MELQNISGLAHLSYLRQKNKALEPWTPLSLPWQSSPLSLGHAGPGHLSPSKSYIVTSSFPEDGWAVTSNPGVSGVQMILQMF